MSLTLPTPLPDESIYSLVCRYLMLTFPDKKRVSQALFGHEQVLSGPEALGNSIEFLHRQGGKQFWPVLDDMLRAMTAYPLYGVFTIKREQGWLRKTIASFYPGQRHVLYRGFYHPDHKVDCLKYCPECVHNDLDEFGVAYWHRSHALPFIRSCWRHGCDLVELDFKGNKYALPEQGGGVVKSSRLHQDLAKVAAQILRKANPKVLCREKVCLAFMETVGCKEHDELVRVAGDIQRSIESQYSSVELDCVGVRRSFSQGGKRPWVLEVFNTATIVSISEYLLVVFELYGSWKKFFKFMKEVVPQRMLK